MVITTTKKQNFGKTKMLSHNEIRSRDCIKLFIKSKPSLGLDIVLVYLSNGCLVMRYINYDIII